MMQWTAVLTVLAAIGLPGAAWAQSGNVDWADIDCLQSRIVPAEGLRCRATNKLTSDALSTGEALYRYWNASGTINDVKYYYYVAEALSSKSAIMPEQGLADAVRVRSPQGRGSANMSDVVQRQDADFVSFEGPGKESCVGIRKIGPSHAQGAKWVLYATRCAPQGQLVADADIATFVRQARVRQ
jgi:hypothetical protein